MTLRDKRRSRGRDGLVLTLACDGCGRTERWDPFWSLTKMGTLRLEGPSHGFYVDGGSVLCGKCAGERLNNPAQRETWAEYERRNVERDQDERAFLESLTSRYPALELRDA